MLHNVSLHAKFQKLYSKYLPETRLGIVGRRTGFLLAFLLVKRLYFNTVWFNMASFEELADQTKEAVENVARVYIYRILFALS